jgi:hypothetical protein
VYQSYQSHTSLADIAIDDTWSVNVCSDAVMNSQLTVVKCEALPDRGLLNGGTKKSLAIESTDPTAAP